MSKKCYEFYEGITPPNTQNHESCSSRWKKHLHSSLNKWHQALIAAVSRHESDANYYDKINPPQHKVGPTPVLRTQSSAVDGDEDGCPTIQEIRVENPSSSEGSIPRAMGRNKAQRLKEKGKAKDDYADQQEVAASLRLMGKQNAFVAVERNRSHEERA
ncbi:hypothetical protein D8674_021818 [Pyrus ussuriensis x Pyrus communis]|uniref:No apical meristem-associated C-terminal domain-containing protein n=1 Tax=Pyrus ussuriensis x Pyrus communis TaxID=2448454 RepID=A0A5N5GPR5_9ROSA|nr:hypothetical protein D8674_021818 [Pyrus ussuriensis x Pyrus communis]